LPFEAETPTAMMFQHAYEEPFPLAEAAPELPQPIVDIIERMMAKDPDARNASCTAVRADVRAFCEGRALSSRAPAVAGPVPKSRAPAQASKVPRPVLARPPRLEPWDDEQFMASLEGGTRQGPWHRLREFAVTLFRRHAPEIVKNLQSTTQQVESALADYERRRNRLAQLRDEARSLANELSKQVRTQEAALEKKEKESLPEESLAEEQEQLEALRQQRDEQAQSLEGIEQQFIRADGTLARLRSQNSSLKARLRAAQASQAVYEQEQRTGRWRRWPLLAVAGAAMLGMLLLGIIFFIKYRGADGRTRELTVGVSTTSEKTTKGSSEQGSKPGETLPARYRNSLGMEFVLVPRGKFWMGGGNGSLNDAKEVEIPYEFYVGVYEVTQDEWQTITGTNPSWFSRTGRGKDKVKDIPDEELKHFPVENVSWSDAQLFLQALNAREKELGWVYRLPKAAEWEYACRGGPRANKDEYGYNGSSVFKCKAREKRPSNR
jgi:formylglycine-generating enzyme required for sulfatase activity